MIGIFASTSTAMSKNASISSGDRIKGLIKALEKGECSGFVEDFDRDEFLKDLHRKMEELGTAGTTTVKEKRKANFRGE